MKKTYITLLTLSATLAGTAAAATLIPDESDYTITTSGDYTSNWGVANLVTIERNVNVYAASISLSVNDYHIKSGASLNRSGDGTDFAIDFGKLLILKNLSLASSITSKNDLGYIGNTANHSLPAELSHLDFGDIHTFSNVTLTNVKISTVKQIYFDNVTLSGVNTGHNPNYTATANRLTLDLGTYANAPIDFTLLGNGATTTVTESLTLDIDFGDLTSINNVSIALNGLALADGLDTSDISIDGYAITGGEFVASGTGYSFTGSLQIIPEPSTATLSLLALAGLLARRRRKTA